MALTESYFIDQRQQAIKNGIDRNKAFVHAINRCKQQGFLKGFVEREEFIMEYVPIFSREDELSI